MDPNKKNPTIKQENHSYGFIEYDENCKSDFIISPLNVNYRDLVSFVPSKKCLFMVNKKWKLMRKRLESEKEFQKVPLPCGSDIEITQIFPDLIGYHCIILSNTKIYLYLSIQVDLAVPLKKLKGLNITSIAYPSNIDKNSTGTMLIGCNNGDIYTYEIVIPKNMEIEEMDPKRVFHFPCGHSVNGLVFET